jgi:hypothetical protein
MQVPTSDRTVVRVPPLPEGYSIDPETLDLLRQGLPRFGWQPADWVAQMTIVQSDLGPVAAFGREDGYPPDVGVDLGTGHVVRVVPMGKDPISGYYARSLSVFLEEVRQFNAMLPLYSAAERDAHQSGPSPQALAVGRIEVMLNALDPLSFEGVWQLHMDPIWYGDYADLVELKQDTEPHSWVVVDGKHVPFSLPEEADARSDTPPTK